MEIIYRTFDGKEFDNEADAAYHENCIKDGLMMWDRFGNPTDKIPDALIVYFKSTNAAEYFDVLAKEQCGHPDEFDTTTRIGFYVWDEWDAEYRHVEADIVKMLSIAYKSVKEREAE